MNSARRWLSTGGKCPSLVFIDRRVRIVCPKQAPITRGLKTSRRILANLPAMSYGGASARSGLSLALLAFRDFFPIDGDIARRLDADAHLRTVHRHHGHFHIIANAQSLTGAASEYQHVMAPGNLTIPHVINS
jgi:hypothetical protein